MCRENMPGIAGIACMKQRSAGCAEVDALGIAIVGGHRFAQDEVVGIGLREALGQKLPRLAAIAAARHAEFALGDIALFRRNDGNRKERVFFSGGYGQAETEPRSKAIRNVDPFLPRKIAAVDTAMVLLVERIRIAGMRFQFVDALADFGKFFRAKIDKDVSVER